MTDKKQDKRTAPPEGKVEKRKVVMRSAILQADGTTANIEATDYVPVDILDDYEADARERWQVVEVTRDKHDPGPGGDQGETKRPVFKKKG
jgi:hypothetical protein